MDIQVVTVSGYGMVERVEPMRETCGETVVMHPDLPPMNSERFDAWLAEWHREHNGQTNDVLSAYTQEWQVR